MGAADPEVEKMGINFISFSFVAILKLDTL